MHTATNAVPAAIAAPEKNEAETTFAASLGSRDQTGINSLNPTDQHPIEQAAGSYTKRLATVTAKLAMRGFSLYPLHDETLLVGAYGLSKVLPSLEAAERFSRMVGAAQ